MQVSLDCKDIVDIDRKRADNTIKNDLNTLVVMVLILATEADIGDFASIVFNLCNSTGSHFVPSIIIEVWKEEFWNAVSSICLLCQNLF